MTTQGRYLAIVLLTVYVAVAVVDCQECSRADACSGMTNVIMVNNTKLCCSTPNMEPNVEQGQADNMTKCFCLNKQQRQETTQAGGIDINMCSTDCMFNNRRCVSGNQQRCCPAFMTIDATFSNGNFLNCRCISDQQAQESMCRDANASQAVRHSIVGLLAAVLLTLSL